MIEMDTTGCCGDASWRGHKCDYHRGMEAGIDKALDLPTVQQWRLRSEAIDAEPMQDYPRLKGEAYQRVAGHNKLLARLRAIVEPS